MSEFLPKDHLELYDALDLVGRAMFGESWLGVDGYNAEYDETVKSGFPNPKEADRRAREDYSPCRAATLELRQMLFGTAPDYDDAVRAIFLASTGKVRKIWAHEWGRDDALKLFRTGRIKFNTSNNDFVRLSTREAGEIVEGRILVSERDIKSLLNSTSNQKSGPTALSGKRSTIAAERRCQAWLEEMMRNGPSTKAKIIYQREAISKFGVSVRSFLQAWRNAISSTSAVTWSRPGRKS